MAGEADDPGVPGEDLLAPAGELVEVPLQEGLDVIPPLPVADC